MGLGRAAAGGWPFRAAVRAAALARSQAQFQAAAQYRAVHSVHPMRGPLLDRDAYVSQTELRHQLDGFHDAARTGWPVARVLFDAARKAAADAGERAASGG